MTRSRRGVEGHEGAARVTKARAVIADVAYAQRLADLQAASKAIGDTPEQRLSWLVHFAAENQSSWQSATVAAHANCIQALMVPLPQNFLGGIALPPPLPIDDLRQVHYELREMLHRAVNAEVGAAMMLPADTREVGLVRASAVGKKPAIWGSIYRYTSARGVLYVARDLILTAGDQLVACGHCNSPFVAFKKQQFCTERCAQKFRNVKKADAKKARKQQGAHDGKQKTARSARAR